MASVDPALTAASPKPDASVLRVLLIEDERTDALLHARYLLKAGDTIRRDVHVTHVTTLHAALQILSSHVFDVAVLDLNLPDARGLRCIEALRAEYSNMAIVVLTGDDDVLVASQAVAHGAQDYLVKGRIEPGALGRALLYAVVRLASHEEYRALFDANPVPALVFDLATRAILEVNKAACARYGWSRQEFLGLCIDDLSSRRAPGPTETRATESGIEMHRTRTGEERHVKVSAHRLAFRGRDACLIQCDDAGSSRR